MLSELHKLSKLIWQKKKMLIYKSWKKFFYSAVLMYTIKRLLWNLQ